MDFKGYAWSLIGVATVIALAEELAPRGLRRVLSFSLGIYLLCAVILPLPSLIRKGLDLSLDYPDYSQGGEEYFNTVLEASSEGVERALAERFGFSTELCEVTLIGFDAYALTADEVIVTLRGEAAYGDFFAVRSYVLEIFGGNNGKGTECRVEPSFK